VARVFLALGSEWQPRLFMAFELCCSSGKACQRHRSHTSVALAMVDRDALRTPNRNHRIGRMRAKPLDPMVRQERLQGLRNVPLIAASLAQLGRDLLRSRHATSP
jgi:hypothetical protein